MKSFKETVEQFDKITPIYKPPKIIKAIDVMQLLKDLNENAPDEFNAKVNSIILSQKQYDLYVGDKE